MKTKEQIEARILELEGEKDYWRLEASKAHECHIPEGYDEYSRNNAAQFAAQVAALHWVLDPL